MELSPEYERSEVGVIPRDWNVVNVGSLASFTSGVGIRVSSLSAETSDMPVPVFGGNGIAGYTNRPLVHEPTVVVGRVGQKCGEVYLTSGPAWITDNALYPRTKHRQFDVRFLAFALSGAGLNDVRNRNDLPLVTQAILHSVQVAWPARIEEQRAIATALSDVDVALCGLDRLIAKKRDLKQAAMQRLLTGETRLPGFQEEWDVKSLGELGEVSGGGVDKKIRPGERRVRLLNYMDVYRRSFVYSIDLDHVVTARDEQVAKCAVRKGDVFFTPSSEMPFDIAASAVAMEEIPDATYSYHVVRLRLAVDWDVMFRAYIFKTKDFLIQAARASEGSGVRYVITQGRFRSLSVRFPSDKREQTAIAEILFDMDAELSSLEARRDKTRDLKRGMMQELLTGRKRLI